MLFTSKAAKDCYFVVIFDEDGNIVGCGEVG